MEEFKKIYITTTGGNTAQLAYTEERWRILSEVMEDYDFKTIKIDNFIFSIQEITTIHRQ
ncbi:MULTISPECIES: hypothetical protein [unclassified Lactococcus]|uniref:hypothetical protein n=1 Tax=unclassified Lactococcus TaxID=2643510 RepID=UPI0011CC91EC|nr:MULTISPECIES: hypothetical protein [unclassified Lactococcus]MQW23266.1 hypothetical protein [Lactococcus sp. dk101]TXK38066.1 hypothetical protein FVP42_06550 [Lactococcus sp. dk310]TXK49745.1 hypothetical protein FVP43_06520 [Lactococcus sp. dk322]